ncbi:MAG TPA: nicotinamide riboside transporter PnuC [Saprospiraceae bacterium]|nr:nicotinamide riboside transporter PnuC [Saprospiraceae bacterium]HOY11816.1 nicotinamide riboside transporter PnuC [Saprospiraceae bacterium]HPN68022.1 nicotinamide riboside transporter PnuC [Saprospiraceae bacterium]
MIEILGFSFALLGILLAIKQNKWNWVSNMISSVFYFFAFYEVQLIADAYLQLVFFVMGMVGFYNWNNPQYASLEAVSTMTKSEMFQYSLSFFGLAALVIGYTSLYTASDYPWWDGTLTAASVIATIMAIRKKIENWYLWMVIDLAYIPLYLIKGYHLSGLLYAIYIVLAFIAYKEWKKHLHKNIAL